MELIKPRTLKKGDLISLMSPSSYTPPEEAMAAAQALEKIGYRVFVHPQNYLRDHASAGGTEDKVAALHDLFRNPDVKAIFCLRGGYQALHMLDRIDYDLIRAHPKILIGFSDITALQSAILKQSGLVTFHGTNGRSFRRLDETDAEENQSNHTMLEILSGQMPDDLFRGYPVRTLKSGKANGKIFGGNIQIIASLIEAGEIYHPDFKDCLFIIEDLMEEITKLDRQLGAWRLRGLFKQIAGLIVGHMTDIRDTPGVAGPFVYGFEEILLRHTADLTGPLVVNAPFGHDNPNYPFPQGITAILNASQNQATLSLAENVFNDE